ncbi:MAG: hypothetical protein Q8K74_07540 [Candidatus Nitrotoga sp.]|nr:hypothetical protein [Candidatus Nitrotoga sp.]
MKKIYIVKVHHREQYCSIQMLQLLIAQAIASARFSDVLVVRVWERYV